MKQSAPLDTAPVHPPVRRWNPYLIGTLALVGLALLFAGSHAWLSAVDERVAAALRGGTVAALATMLGTLPVLLSQQFSQRMFDTLLGFGAGVMLAACAFSLIIPGLAAAQTQGMGPWASGLVVSAGILLGGMMLLAIDRLVPHEHFVKGLEGLPAQKLKRTYLFILAIVLHNFPEGLAIGVAFGGTDQVGATALATGISIQDVPEGLVVALALRGIGYSRFKAVSMGGASGLVEPLAAVLGASIIGVSAMLLPWGLAFAAGAMLYVISHEVIPESHRAGHESFATGGLMIGFVLMMLLDTALG